MSKDNIAIAGVLTFRVDRNGQLRISELVDQYGGVQETVLTKEQTETVRKLLEGK